MTVDQMKDALHDASYDAWNLQAVVFQPATMQMHVSVNRQPAAAGPYQTFDVRRLLAE